MEQVKITLGGKTRERLRTGRSQNQHVVGSAAEITSWDINKFFKHFQFVVDRVVDTYYNVYEKYVSKEDLYSEAYLGLVEYYNSDRRMKDNKAATLHMHVVDAVSVRVENYCLMEYSAYVNKEENAVSFDTQCLSGRPELVEVYETINTLLNSLADERKESIMRMYYLDEYNQTEIANTLGCSSTCIRYILNNAMFDIRKEMLGIKEAVRLRREEEM